MLHTVHAKGAAQHVCLGCRRSPAQVVVQRQQQIYSAWGSYVSPVGTLAWPQKCVIGEGIGSSWGRCHGLFKYIARISRPALLLLQLQMLGPGMQI